MRVDRFEDKFYSPWRSEIACNAIRPGRGNDAFPKYVTRLRLRAELETFSFQGLNIRVDLQPALAFLKCQHDSVRPLTTIVWSHKLM